MTEILWHGRGGQGAFTAARLLGAAYAMKSENNFALAFPSFGPERRGAPIRAFTKLSKRLVSDRSEISKADYSIFLDDTLFSENAFSELKDNGIILINSKKQFSDKRIKAIDGYKISEEFLKAPIVNTIMLGAFSVFYDGISEDDIERAISENMPEKIRQKNISAMKAAGKELF